VTLAKPELIRLKGVVPSRNTLVTNDPGQARGWSANRRLKSDRSPISVLPCSMHKLRASTSLLTNDDLALL
jgi:hypothetical protein